MSTPPGRRGAPMAEHPTSVLLTVEQLRRRVPGGIGTYTGGLLGGLEACARAGERVDMTLLASRAPGREQGADPLAAYGRPLRTSRLPSRLLTRAWDRRLVHAPVGFDVVHSVSPAAPPLRRSSPGRAAVTVHDVAWRRHPEATTRRGRRWHEAALARAVRDGASLVTPSRLVAADLASGGVDPARITVIPSGADHLPAPDAPAATLLLERLGVTGEYLLAVGTVEPRKNLDRLFSAYGAVRPSLPEPWPLVVVGPAGWGRTPGGDGGAEGAVFAGAVGGAVLAGLYRGARAFAYVPLTEGYGFPPLEALAAGTPAVVSDTVPSVRDLGETGPPPARLVDPLDVNAMRAALHEVLMDDSVRAELSVRGAAHAWARTWQGAAAGYLGFWRSLA